MNKNIALALLAGLLAGASTVSAAEPSPNKPTSDSAGNPPKITHDWPSYTEPDGTFADLSRVPLLDDLSRAKLLWVSEYDDLGYGKTSSRRGHAYGSQTKPSGSVCPIVAGGLVIAGYFSPKNNVVANGLAVAGGRLVVTCVDGTVATFAAP